MTKRVLWITDEVPDRNLGGGSIRQYHLIRRMAEEATVDLVVAGQLRDDQVRASLGRVVELSHPPAMASNVRTWFTARQGLIPGRLPSDLTTSRRLLNVILPQLGDTESYDLVQVEHEQLAELLGRSHSNPWVITFHNLLSVRLRQWSRLIETRRGRWLAERDADHVRRFERKMADRYDLAIAMSAEDAESLGGRTVVVPNGVDLDRFRPTALPNEPRLLLSASFNWLPNIDGAEWFCREVLPLIRHEIAGAKVLLVGREPDPRIRDLEDVPGVEAYFDVPSLVPYLDSCRVALVPLRIGSGTRLKALEAMASARPLAGTTIGLEGLGLRDGESAAIADEPHGMAQRIIRLCRDERHAIDLAEAGRELAITRFSWDHVAALYMEQVTALVDLDLPASTSDSAT